MNKILFPITLSLCLHGSQPIYKNLVESEMNSVKKDTEEVLKNITFQPQNNSTISNFSKSKRKLSQVYDGEMLETSTIYAGCNYNKGKIDYSDCNFKNNGKYKKRAMKPEWEHVVPASNFGKNFPEWAYGDILCTKKNGKAYKGRKCARKVNENFSYMEADIYNMYPVVGAINALRRDYPFTEIAGEARNFGSNLDLEIQNNQIEPQENVKGDIARVYYYMNKTYPGKITISSKELATFDVWNINDPVSIEECKRYSIIKQIQKNINIILENYCKELTK